MRVEEARLREWSAEAASRVELWTRFVDETEAATVAEIGVYRGQFAARLLADCPGIATYYMIDPWRNLADWNKPANKSDQVFEGFFDGVDGAHGRARGQARGAARDDRRGDRPAYPTARSTSRTSTATTRCAGSPST